MNLTADELASLKRGVTAMKALPADDPRSWQFQANIHGMPGPKTNPLFKQCEHGTLQFLTWHRGYLYYFERILRELSGDANLNLPYWDWTTHPTLPGAFLLPADGTNPLFDSTRTINDGSALPDPVVVDDLNSALNLIEFPASGMAGFSRSLEGSPHGAIHVLIGGNMGTVPTSANDPIFWLHHCNIDRVWDRWISMAMNRANPSDAAFLDKTYSFANENGSTETKRVREIISDAQLGYRYDNVQPQAMLSRELVATGPQGKTGTEHLKVASSIKEKMPAAKSKPLGLEPVTEKLSITPAHQETVIQAATKPGRILLQVEGLSAKEVPEFVFAVYVNLPEGDITPKDAKQHYVGTINFFGKVKDAGHDHGGDGTFTETLDATRTIQRLQKAGRWNKESLSVTFRPLTVVPPAGREAAIRTRMEASAKKARPSYKAVHLLIAP